MKDIIIKVKKYFCCLLCGCKKLVKTDFEEGSTAIFESILKEITKSHKSAVEDSIPIEWYAKSLSEYLYKVPKELTKNDCEKLYNEIEKEVKKAIKALDFDALCVVKEKLNNAKRWISTE